MTSDMLWNINNIAVSNVSCFYIREWS